MFRFHALVEEGCSKVHRIVIGVASSHADGSYGLRGPLESVGARLERPGAG
jgi:hypothetical protein